MRSSRSSRPTEQRSSPALIPASASWASRQLAMGRRRRVGDDRVDAPERGGPLRDRQGVDERAARGPTADRPAGQLEREHPARVRELARGDRVLGVARQVGVVDPGDARLRLEPLGQRPGGLGVAGHPDGERGDPAQDEEGGEGRERRTGVDLDRLDRRDSLARAADRAAERVGVPADVLGQRLDDQVGAELEGPAQDGRSERVVDDEQGPVAVGQAGQDRQVGDDDRRVRDRLDVEDAGRPGRQRGVDGGRIRRVDEGDVDAEPPEALGQERPRRAVDRPGGDHPVAGLEDRQEGGVDRGHPRREDRAGLGALELRHRRRERVAGRVGEPRVRVAGPLSGRDRAELLGVLGRERDGLVDRNRVRLLVDARRGGRGLDGPGREAARRGRAVGERSWPDATPTGCRTPLRAGQRGVPTRSLRGPRRVAPPGLPGATGRRRAAAP